MRSSILISGLLLACFFSTWSCQSSETEVLLDKVVVRLIEEPDRIHPMLSKTGVASQIEGKIFLPLINADPESLQLVPVLAESLPKVTILDDGRVRLDYQIKENAKWDNGTSITSKDVLFTVKASFVPGLDNSSMRSYLNLVDSLAVNAEDKKAFSFFLSESYILAVPATGGMPIYPAYYYDQNETLNSYSLSAIRSMDSLTGDMQGFVETFNSNLFSRDSISGAGPYKLTSWKTGQLLTLERKKDWWGDDYTGEIADLTAYPQSIQYLIVPDEATTIAQLKSNMLDIAGDISPVQFKELQNDSSFAREHRFRTPEVFKQYVIYLNTSDPVLRDVEVRKALAHLVDKETFIEDALQGIGRKSGGPIHPAKPYFDSTIQMPELDLIVARNLLENAGWLDLDENGIREKMIKGQQEELVITLLIPGSPLGKSIALRLQENAMKAGVELNIETMPFRNILQRMKEGDFQMAPLSLSTSHFPDDPYQTWHTDNIGGGGYNFMRFGNERTDSIIDGLRTTLDPEEQKEYYSAFQRVVAEHQPAIFLAAPRACIIHKKSIQMPTTVIKPGYLENMAQAVSDESID